MLAGRPVFAQLLDADVVGDGVEVGAHLLLVRDRAHELGQAEQALAHTDHGAPQHDALISNLKNDFRGWAEHDSADLRRAASRVWVVCGR